MKFGVATFFTGQGIGPAATGRVRRAPRGRDMGVIDDEERVEPTVGSG
jgi:hypothetical protein